MAIPIPFLVLVLIRLILKKFTFLQKYWPENKEKKIEKPEKMLVKELLQEKIGQMGKIPLQVAVLFSSARH